MLSYKDHRPRVVSKPIHFVYFIGGLECVGHSFAFVGHFVFLGSNPDFSGFESRHFWVLHVIQKSLGSNPYSLGSNPEISQNDGHI